MRVLLLDELLHGVLCWKCIFIKEEVWCARLSVLCSFSRFRGFSLSFLVGFYLPHSLHQINALRQNVGGLAGPRDVCKVFVQLVEVLCNVHVLAFFGQVHEQVENSVLALAVESLLEVGLDGGCDCMRSAKILSIPIGVGLALSLHLLVYGCDLVVPIGQKFVEKFHGKNLNLLNFLEL